MALRSSCSFLDFGPGIWVCTFGPFGSPCTNVLAVLETPDEYPKTLNTMKVKFEFKIEITELFFVFINCYVGCLQMTQATNYLKYSKFKTCKKICTSKKHVYFISNLKYLINLC